MPADPMLTSAEAATFLGLAEGTLRVWRTQQLKGPRWIKLDPENPKSGVRYDPKDLRAWLEQRKQTPCGEVVA